MFRRPPNISSGEGINLYNLGREHGAVLEQGGYDGANFRLFSPMYQRPSYKLDKSQAVGYYRIRK